MVEMIANGMIPFFIFILFSLIKPFENLRKGRNNKILNGRNLILNISQKMHSSSFAYIDLDAEQYPSHEAKEGVYNIQR